MIRIAEKHGFQMGTLVEVRQEMIISGQIRVFAIVMAEIFSK
jgi:hypothetical protein